MDVNLIAFRTNLAEGGIRNTGFLLAEEINNIPNVHLTLFTDQNSDISKSVESVKMKCKKCWNFSFYTKIIFYLLKHKPANINLCMHWMCAISFFFNKKIKRKPYAVLTHGNEVMDYPKLNAKTKFNRYIRKKVLSDADILFANSDYTKGLCQKITNSENIFVVEPPIQYHDFSVKKEGDYNIFSIGRLVERKGFQDIIMALNVIQKTYHQIKYRLAGDGPYKTELLRLTKSLQLDNCVDFLGRISEKQKEKEFQKCNLFIMTSHEDKDKMETEGYGVCYLEANMYGKWVIGRKTGGVADAIVDDVTGRVMSESDVLSIYEAIKEYYSKANIDVDVIKEWAKKHDIKQIVNQYYKKIECTL